ncbi:GntR family transcriptional regulator [Streptomyces sp. NPDC003077]|uniref:GntR family transcriptional regulator n=1 Tax=Streptomyces sp. NPDC003077 TaxID=3154443 RepID=UPI00339FFF59
MVPTPDPPFRRIAAEIRRRIDEGELAPGERVPSTRQIAREWGVALATATKALTTLRLEGVVEARPRVGTVVAGRRASAPPGRRGAPARPDDGTPPKRREPGARPTADGELTRERIVRAAIEIADAEGLAALSMRSVAARLGVAAMSPYRYVAGKDELVFLMADAAFGERSYPAERPEGWRACLELEAHTLWSLYRDHPWLAQIGSLTRPLPLPNLLVHSDWALTALDGRGLDLTTMMDLHILLYSYVQGLAVNLEREFQAQAETGLSEDQWMERHAVAFAAVIGSARHPMVTKVLTGLGADGYDMDLDALFTFGLRPLLDGFATIVEGAAPGRPGG